MRSEDSLGDAAGLEQREAQEHRVANTCLLYTSGHDDFYLAVFQQVDPDMAGMLLWTCTIMRKCRRPLN